MPDSRATAEIRPMVPQGRAGDGCHDVGTRAAGGYARRRGPLTRDSRRLRPPCHEPEAARRSCERGERGPAVTCSTHCRPTGEPKERPEQCDSIEPDASDATLAIPADLEQRISPLQTACPRIHLNEKLVNT